MRHQSRYVAKPQIQDVDSGCRASGGTLDQLGHLRDEAPGYFNGLGRQLWRHLGTRPGFVIGNGLEVVGEAEEGAQLIIDPRIAPHETMKFRLHPAMSFDHASGSIEDQRLRGMETGEIRCTTSFVGPMMRVEQALRFL